MVKRLFFEKRCLFPFQLAEIPNASLLPFGHGDATSLGAGRVKFLM
jgi:hypothetical protein